MNISIIGLGLIGGSMALRIKAGATIKRRFGFDINHHHQAIALQLGLVDELMSLEEAVRRADLVIISVPVDAAVPVTSNVLDLVEKQVVMDVGSTKAFICNSLKFHPKRHRFVASHPMWGTRHSGPGAATADSFYGKAAVICNAEESDEDAVKLVATFYEHLGMHILNMKDSEHDLHTAYISHLSHVASFALANTVLEKEKEDKNIFELASGGFETTARLAQSNPDMWTPILIQNQKNILDALNEHMLQLQKFKSCLELQDAKGLMELINQANTISRVLN